MGGLKCPRCSDALAFNPAEVEGLGILIDESTEKHLIRGKVRIPAIVREELAIVSCPTCNRLFVAENHWYNNWETVWPLSLTPVPAEVPEPICSAFREARLCLAVGALGGCLFMCRTAIIRLQRQQKVGSLSELSERGVISQHLYGQADEVRLWANMIGHDDFDSKVVDHASCEQLVEYADSLLNAVYVQPTRLAKHKEARRKAKSKEETN